MNILGITAFFHDPSAALLRDGKLVAFVEEERLIRVKHAMGVFPHRSIEYCLRAGGLNFRDLDAIVCHHQMKAILSHDPDMEPYRTIMRCDPSVRDRHRSIFLGAEDQFVSYAKSKGIRKAVFAPHHQTHLATAYYGSGLDSALILSIDGRGDTESAVLAKGTGEAIEILDVAPLPSSLGLLYAGITKFLGYTPFDGEGTVMGLAAYGEDRYREFFESMVSRDGHRFTVSADAGFNELIDPLCKGIPSPLVKMFGAPRCFNPDPRNGVDEHIAASLQALVERTVADYLRFYISQTGVRKLCVAGGVGLNSKMNGYLYRELGLDDLYVFPVAGDAGCAIGAAMWYAKLVQNEAIDPIYTIYRGPEFSPDEIRESLKAMAIRVSEPKDLAASVAALLADHKIVGWFQGRMEGGARALGARSVLFNPMSIKDKDNVNNKVKFREHWRPFAPSVLYEKRRKYMGCDLQAPFMTTTFQVPENAREDIAGAMHIDGTIRIQTLKREDHPLYYDLISAFENLTGVPVVGNTSLNRKGEPIIHTPAQALEMLVSTGMDALAIGSFLVTK